MSAFHELLGFLGGFFFSKKLWKIKKWSRNNYSPRFPFFRWWPSVSAPHELLNKLYTEIITFLWFSVKKNSVKLGTKKTGGDPRSLRSRLEIQRDKKMEIKRAFLYKRYRLLPTFHVIVSHFLVFTEFFFQFAKAVSCLFLALTRFLWFFPSFFLTECLQTSARKSRWRNTKKNIYLLFFIISGFQFVSFPPFVCYLIAFQFFGKKNL